MLSACGGGNDGASTGFEGTRVISELTTDEAQQMCERLGNSAIDAISDAITAETVCRSLAVATTDSPETCELSTSQCLEQIGDAQVREAQEGFSSSDNFQNLGCNDFSFVGKAECQATVAQLEACTNAGVANLKSTFDQLCSSKGPGQSTKTPAETTPEECETLFAACPSLRN